MDIFELNLMTVINWYVIGMFVYIGIKGILAGFTEINYNFEFWETIFYPFHVVYQVGKAIGIIIINILSFIINMFG